MIQETLFSKNIEAIEKTHSNPEYQEKAILAGNGGEALLQGHSVWSLRIIKEESGESVTDGALATLGGKPSEKDCSNCARSLDSLAANSMAKLRALLKEKLALIHWITIMLAIGNPSGSSAVTRVASSGVDIPPTFVISSTSYSSFSYGGTGMTYSTLDLFLMTYPVSVDPNRVQLFNKEKSRLAQTNIPKTQPMGIGVLVKETIALVGDSKNIYTLPMTISGSSVTFGTLTQIVDTATIGGGSFQSGTASPLSTILYGGCYSFTNKFLKVDYNAGASPPRRSLQS